jgi:hypothetical protein
MSASSRCKIAAAQRHGRINIQSQLSSNRVLDVGMTQQSHHFVERGDFKFRERADQFQPFTHSFGWIEQLEPDARDLGPIAAGI